MPQITLDDIAAHRPDVLLPPDAEFADEYAAAVRFGREVAAQASVAIVGICRSAMPWLPQTLSLIEETGAMFREWSSYVFENDSADDTKDVLMSWSDHKQRCISLNVNGRPHLNHTIEPVRTHALAEYRAQCQHWVRHGQRPDFVIVVDTDAWGGWSVDGVATSVAHMAWDNSWYALASYSWAEVNTPNGPMPIHYDAFAARQNHWKRRDQQWFHYWHPPIGSDPVEFNSAFGQLCLYRAERYLQGTYTGEDCEHVCLHRSIARNAAIDEGDYYDGPSYTRLGLNPSSRCVSFWVPTDGRQHRTH
jgi:hypothetical protein